MIRSKNALRDGNCFAQQRLGFFEAIYPHKGVRVVVGCNESSFMFFAVELQTSGIYVSQHAVGFFKPFKRSVLGALFAGTGGGSRRKGAAVVIPREVFWKVFEFWPCSH